MELEQLKKPFPTNLISWRVGATNGDKTKGIALAYIDARDVMERLDAVCGVGNWQCAYPHANGKTSCKIGIKIGEEWVWKENGAGDSDVEAEKGAFSDAFKRAAVLWGIGRYLYDVKNIWVALEPMGKSYKIKNPNDEALIKALNEASGVKNEKPAEQVKMLTGEEFLMLQKELEEAKDLAELNLVKEKLTASKSRMTPQQGKTLGVILTKRGTDLIVQEVQGAK